jgi:hypothetical protein
LASEHTLSLKVPETAFWPEPLGANFTVIAPLLASLFCQSPAAFEKTFFPPTSAPKNCRSFAPSAAKRYGYWSLTWKSPVATSRKATEQVAPCAQPGGDDVSMKKLSAQTAWPHSPIGTAAVATCFVSRSGVAAASARGER